MRIVEAVPHARECYTTGNTIVQWAHARYCAAHHEDGSKRAATDRPKLTGVATDSCGVQLAALLLHGTPTLAEHDQGVRWVGLDDPDFYLMGKVGGGFGESSARPT